jgi:hypothetical protein
MRRRFSEFLDRHENSDDAEAIVSAEEHEISLYERHREFISYGYYVARKVH